MKVSDEEKVYRKIERKRKKDKDDWLLEKRKQNIDELKKKTVILKK